MDKTIYTEESVRNLQLYRTALKDIDAKIRLMEKTHDMMAAMINDIEHITEFYREIPLNVGKPHPDDRTHSFDIDAVPDNGRSAKIYHAATEPDSVDRWGLYIYDFSLHDLYRERWMGCEYTREEAVIAAKEWVCLGLVKPS